MLMLMVIDGANIVYPEVSILLQGFLSILVIARNVCGQHKEKRSQRPRLV